MEFPLGVLGVALATVILPTLSEQHAKASKEEFSATLDWALRLVLVFALPASLGLIVLAQPLLATIFYGGEFTALDVSMATASLIAYALGILGFILVKVLTPGYFSRQDTRTPVRIGIYSLVLNMMLNVVFVLGLIRGGFYAPHAGLALATTLSALFNAVLLYKGLVVEGVFRPRPGWAKLMAQVLMACMAMVISVYILQRTVGNWLQLSLFERVGSLLVCVSVGIGVYLGVCFILGLRIKNLRQTPRLEL